MEPLTSLMESLDYLQIVKMPTFISGSLLDHVYIRQANKGNIDCSVISVYYSDHDAIKITLRIYLDLSFIFDKDHNRLPVYSTVSRF